MSEGYKRRPKEHLFRLIARRSEKTPNFALLLGAGASRTSNVKCASDMVVEWQQQLYIQSKSGEPIDKWLETQRWHNDDDEYGLLFEKVCDQPAQRRIFIEECIKNARPSWGYIYLANIIANDFFNVIFTPNFDDLLNEACFVYAGCKPLVCAHDSAVSGIRITSNRPKIIKLHGDFLFDNIKNTIRETDSLEKNMQMKFMQFSREYGLVVIGYGGNDRSIMDILDSMVKPSEQEQYFPNGIYWCTPKEANISRKLDKLLQREKVFLVEIDGFDEFMAELNQFLGLSLPTSNRDPYKATTERLNAFISQNPSLKNDLIKKDIEKLVTKIKEFEEVLSKELDLEDARLIPYLLLLNLAFLSHKYSDVIKYSEKALKQKSEPIRYTLYLHTCIAKTQKRHLN